MSTLSPTRLIPASVMLFASVMLLTTGTAEANNPLHDFDRGTTDGLARSASGLYYGATMGRGSMSVSCDLCRHRPSLSEGLSLTAHAGMKLGRRLGIYSEYWLVRWRDRDGDWFDDADIHSITQQTISAGAQLWVTRRLFIRAALGYGRHSTDIDYSKPEGVLFAANGETPEVRDGDGSSSSVASVVGAGFELVRTRTFGLSAEVRYGRNRIDSKDRDVSSFAASIGLSWF